MKEELFIYLAWFSVMYVSLICEAKRFFNNREQILCCIQKYWWPVYLYKWRGWYKDVVTFSHTIIMRTVDSTVVVLPAAIFEDLAFDEIWISLGMRKSWRNSLIHELVTVLAPDRSRGPLVFNASGSIGDKTLFAGKIKVTARYRWEWNPGVTTLFKDMRLQPQKLFT